MVKDRRELAGILVREHQPLLLCVPAVWPVSQRDVDDGLCTADLREVDLDGRGLHMLAVLGGRPAIQGGDHSDRFTDVVQSPHRVASGDLVLMEGRVLFDPAPRRARTRTGVVAALRVAGGTQPDQGSRVDVSGEGSAGRAGRGGSSDDGLMVLGLLVGLRI
jgi:hypothetical protein